MSTPTTTDRFLEGTGIDEDHYDEWCEHMGYDPNTDHADEYLDANPDDDGWHEGERYDNEPANCGRSADFIYDPGAGEY